MGTKNAKNKEKPPKSLEFWGFSGVFLLVGAIGIEPTTLCMSILIFALQTPSKIRENSILI